MRISVAAEIEDSHLYW